MSLWHGYFETLPFEMSAANISGEIVDNLLMLSLTIPNLREFSNHSQGAWEIQKILGCLPQKPIRWFVDIVRGRFEAFGRSNQAAFDRQDIQTFLLPPDGSCLFDAIASVPDQDPSREDVEAIADLFALAEEDGTVAHELPELLNHFDPFGRIVPDMIVERLADSLRAAGIEKIRDLGRFGGAYNMNSPAWRKIAVALCVRVHGLSVSAEERRYGYSSLVSRGPRHWSGTPVGTLHPRWQQAVDEAAKKLEDETDPVLRSFWEWRLYDARSTLEREKGHLEERS